MHWHDMDGWSWMWMVITMALFWGVLIIGLVALLRTRDRQNPRPPTAQETLDDRLARGEITIEEYEQRWDALRRRRPSIGRRPDKGP
jgi:putative membrane protein